MSGTEENGDIAGDGNDFGKGTVFLDNEKGEIRNVLLISSPYDFFLLEEEGRLSQLFKEVYLQRDRNYIPQIRRVGTGHKALEIFDGGWVDLMVIFNHPPDMKITDIASQAKERYPDIPVIFLANNTPELKRIANSPRSSDLDGIFTWNGDGEIFLGIVQLMEDRYQLFRMKHPGCRDIIMLIQDDITGYSLYVNQIYNQIWGHMENIMKSRLSSSEKELRRSRRPILLLARDRDEAMEQIEGDPGRILMAILDRTGELGCQEIEEKLSGLEIPLMVIDPHGGREGEYPGKIVLSTDMPSLESVLIDFLRRNMSAGDLIIRDLQGSEIARASDIFSLERGLIKAPDEVLDFYLKFGHISKWLRGRGDIELAEGLESVTGGELSGMELRKKVLDLVDERKRSMDHPISKVFCGGGRAIRFTKIGRGAMGGKARGIAFMNKVMEGEFKEPSFPKMKISIPATAVVCTDIFIDFLRMNNLLRKDLLSSPDERIAEAFMKADLPSTALGLLRNLVEEYRGPLAVRSSSVLEDALFQPFAGVYASMMLSNSSMETDVRFRNLTNAVKYVFASTFFEGARSYIEATPNRIEDERMGVIIQEVVGEEHGDYFYPLISGVARSFDYWPYGRCSSEDGTASLALGLGKTIVDGGTSFRFCPAHPKVPHYGDVKELMGISQKYFYAIKKGKHLYSSKLDEETTLSRLDLEEAKKHGTLEMVASTYSPDNDRLYPGIGRDGIRVIDFSPVIDSDDLPLAKVVHHVLETSENALGFPVEIEFAINRVDGEAIFSLLQVRSMVTSDLDDGLEGVEVEEGDAFLRSDDVLGNGVIDGIRDIVYVQRDLDMSRSNVVANEVKDINGKLRSEGRPYILIGPGRWGSTDPWLGIPVVWSDISAVKAVVETPVNHRRIDPSQGSHFFHNLSSLKIGYFTVKPSREEEVDWNWLEKLKVVKEGNHTLHLRSEIPIKIAIDGRKGKGAILKNPGDKKVING